MLLNVIWPSVPIDALIFYLIIIPEKYQWHPFPFPVGYNCILWNI